nr:K848 [uncultured bacterium]
MPPLAGGLFNIGSSAPRASDGCARAQSGSGEDIGVCARGQARSLGSG